MQPWKRPRSEGYESAHITCGNFYCELNPIEFVWAQIKNGVAVKNTTFTTKDVHNRRLAEMEEVTPKN